MNANRFWEKVRRGAPDECWIWLAGTNAGYGAFRVDGRVKKAHHVSIFLETGEWPAENRHVCHRCDNRLCVNPAHLYQGTATDNALDRSVSAERGPRQKFRIATGTGTGLRIATGPGVAQR